MIVKLQKTKIQNSGAIVNTYVASLLHAQEKNFNDGKNNLSCPKNLFLKSQGGLFWNDEQNIKY